MSDEAVLCLQFKQEEVKKHQADVGDEMEQCKKFLRNLETDKDDLIELILNHRDEQVSGSCLLSLYVV